MTPVTASLIRMAAMVPGEHPEGGFEGSGFRSFPDKFSRQGAQKGSDYGSEGWEKDGAYNHARNAAPDSRLSCTGEARGCHGEQGIKKRRRQGYNSQQDYQPQRVYSP